MHPVPTARWHTRTASTTRHPHRSSCRPAGVGLSGSRRRPVVARRPPRRAARSSPPPTAPSLPRLLWLDRQRHASWWPRAECAALTNHRASGRGSRLGGSLATGSGSLAAAERGPGTFVFRVHLLNYCDWLGDDSEEIDFIFTYILLASKLDPWAGRLRPLPVAGRVGARRAADAGTSAGERRAAVLTVVVRARRLLGAWLHVRQRRLRRRRVPAGARGPIRRSLPLPVAGRAGARRAAVGTSAGARRAAVVTVVGRARRMSGAWLHLR